MSLHARIDYFRYAAQAQAQPLFCDMRLSVELGQSLAIVGKSGSGKSTLARLLAGLHTSHDIVRASVTCCGKEVKQPRSPVALVLQDYKRAVYPWMPVIENIRLGQRSASDDSVRRVTCTLGIEPLLSRFPATLSGGQLQRVQIARAVLSDAKYVVFDEPTSSLDVELRDSVLEAVQHVVADGTRGCIYVTHRLEETVFVADRVRVLHGPVNAPRVLSEEIPISRRGINSEFWAHLDSSALKDMIAIEKELRR
jgi:ABC-type nitrate/sulfonate/bicarbonate transport system ATPase subunit